MADPFERIASYYDALVDRYGADPRACDYGSLESQKTKFRVLSEVVDLRNKRLLDVGCGLGDFADYLAQNYENIEYVGIDISPKMVETARRLRPDLAIHLSNMLDSRFAEPFDVVTANGIFYLLGDDAGTLMPRLVQRMYECARDAVAFSSLSVWAADPQPGEFHADPGWTLDLCRALTPWVVLRHDYHPRDFTVYLYRRRPARGFTGRRPR